MNNYKELNIWKGSIELVKKIYTITSEYPRNERFGLVDQIKRASISVPSNIAEGSGRDTLPQTSHFINIALGSLCELETQIIVSTELNFIPKDEAHQILNDVIKLKKMTWSYLKSLKKP